MGMAIRLEVILYIRESLFSILRWLSLCQCRDCIMSVTRSLSIVMFDPSGSSTLDRFNFRDIGISEWTPNCGAIL